MRVWRKVRRVLLKLPMVTCNRRRISHTRTHICFLEEDDHNFFLARIWKVQLAAFYHEGKKSR